MEVVTNVCSYIIALNDFYEGSESVEKFTR